MFTLILCFFQQLRLCCRHQLELVYTKQRNSLKDSGGRQEESRQTSAEESTQILEGKPVAGKPFLLWLLFRLASFVWPYLEASLPTFQSMSNTPTPVFRRKKTPHFPVLSVFRVEILTDWRSSKVISKPLARDWRWRRCRGPQNIFPTSHEWRWEKSPKHRSLQNMGCPQETGTSSSCFCCCFDFFFLRQDLMQPKLASNSV